MKTLLYLGLLLVITGLVYNVILLRGPMGRELRPRQIFATAPWRISALLVALGVVMLLVAGR